jgi:hypothetical protein
MSSRWPSRLAALSHATQVLGHTIFSYMNIATGIEGMPMELLRPSRNRRGSLDEPVSVLQECSTKRYLIHMNWEISSGLLKVVSNGERERERGIEGRRKGSQNMF